VTLPYFDFSTADPTKLDYGVYPQSNSSTTIIASDYGAAVLDNTLSPLVHNPTNNISDKYITVIGANDGQHGGMIAGTVVGSVVTPAQITGDVDDYLPSTARYALVWDVATDALRIGTGFGGGVEGKVLIVRNSGSQNFRLRHQNASSAAANRFVTWDGTDILIRPNEFQVFVYTASRWRQMFWHPSQSNASDIISPTELSGSVNNYGPASAMFTKVWRVSASGAFNITGIDWSVITPQTSPAFIDRLVLINVGATNNIGLTHQDAASDADKRIITGPAGGTFSLVAAGGACTLTYDVTSSRWRLIGSNA
jgi:hypothetical protein